MSILIFYDISYIMSRKTLTKGKYQLLYRRINNFMAKEKNAKGLISRMRISWQNASLINKVAVVGTLSSTLGLLISIGVLLSS